MIDPSNNTKLMMLLVIVCPSLAVMMKCGKVKSEKVLIAAILSFLFWIPGIVYAYWTCFKSTEKIVADIDSERQIENTTVVKLHSPVPKHPKANQILSFPTTLTSVVIHFPNDLLVPEVENNNISTENKTCMCNGMEQDHKNTKYFATGLIVIFFAYAAYLIVTDGGKENTTITFAKLNENISNKFMVLTGQKEPEMTLEEIAKKNDLDLLKANSILNGVQGNTGATGTSGNTGTGNAGSSGSGSIDSGSSGTGDAGNANSSNTGNPAGSTGANPAGNTGGTLS